MWWRGPQRQWVQHLRFINGLAWNMVRGARKLFWWSRLMLRGTWEKARWTEPMFRGI